MLHQRWGCLLLLCLGLLAALPVAAQDAVFSDSFEGFELGPNSDEDAARALIRRWVDGYHQGESVSRASS